MGAIKCKSKVIGKAEYVLMSQLPCCTDASVWWVTNDCIPVYLGTSQPPKRSTPVRIKVQSAELLWRSHTIDQMHGNIPGSWLLLILGQEPFCPADLLTAEKLRTSVHCQTNTLYATYFPPYVFWHLRCIMKDNSKQVSFVWMRFGGCFHDEEHSPNKCKTLDDEGLHDFEQTVAGS